MNLTNPQHPAGRIRFAKPKPFRRATITVGATRIRPRRWQHVSAADLAEGDVVPGVGLLRDVTRLGSTVTVHGGADNTAGYGADEPVWAFTAGPDTTP